MDNLENIGFYTLTDYRAKNVSTKTPLWRCELILTDVCNFKCPYCRGVKDFKGNLEYTEAEDIVIKWIAGGLKNIRFSGGEPTVWKGLTDLVKLAKAGGIERIAISTNGSAKTGKYQELIDAGVNDFSVSLDACCASTGDMLAGNIKGAWRKVVDNIQFLSQKAYVTVGVVVTEDNLRELNDIVVFADSLGVSDIRLISAAQWNSPEIFEDLISDERILEKYPILNYRINNFNSHRNVRGIKENDFSKCNLMLDDMAIVGTKHYPCIIYMREGGSAIGDTKGKSIEQIRQERKNFIDVHDPHTDFICKNNCLDVCIDYNNRVEILQRKLVNVD